MMKRSIVRASALGTVALGIVATAMTAGCASDSTGSPSNEPTSAQAQKASITSQGVTVNGCTATGTFDIQSPEVIQFIALDRSTLSNAQMHLYTVDDQGHTTQVDRTAQTVDSSGSQVAVVWSDETLLIGQVAIASLRASQQASAASHQAKSANASQDASNQTNGSNASQNASNQGSGQEASNGASMRQAQSTSAQDSTTQSTASTADHVASTTGDQAHSAHGATTTTTTTATTQANQSAANDDAQSNAGQTQASSLAYDDLQSLDSHHLLVQVTVTADQAQSELRLSQGSNGMVTDVESFPIDTSLCQAAHRAP